MSDQNQKKYNKCYVFRKVEVPCEAVRKGDIFYLQAGVSDTPLNKFDFYIATEDAKKVDGPEEVLIPSLKVALVQDMFGSTNL